MARIVKEYDARHAEFLDVAQTLFFSKGYEQTSVQDIINTVGVAKGTFYHYFRSKVEVLDALVQRMFEQTLASLEPLKLFKHDFTRSAFTTFQRNQSRAINVISKKIESLNPDLWAEAHLDFQIKN